MSKLESLHHDTSAKGALDADPFGIMPSWLAVARAWSAAPQALGARFGDYFAGLVEIHNQVMTRAMGQDVRDVVKALPVDERFQDPSWTRNPWFDLMKEHYLHATRSLEDAIFAAPDLDAKTRRRAAFWARQVLNAIAPSNFLWSNPLALHGFINSGGMSLVKGFQQWLQDIERRDVSMVDGDALVIGRDIAATHGQVVYRNRLMEVIQYAPSTGTVHAIPVVIIAPWINKYYVLDLDARKSMVRYLVEQGFTVFMTSWKNPDASMAQVGFDDYLREGALQIVEVARQICGVPQVHAVGYCIGGTLLATLLAWLGHGSARERSPIAHATLFTTLTDFTEPGDIDVFITDKSVEFIEAMMEQNGGVLDGKSMADSFRMLRANSLIWHYVVQNYLFGKEPAPLDVLQWNVDTTRLPAAMHSFYLRELYLHNRLVKPDSLSIAGRSIDLGMVRTPLYLVGTEQDHIAPWRETFKLAGLVRGPVHYTLAASGHILGVLSPPVKPPKRWYWSGVATHATDPDSWLDSQTRMPGSWWDNWTGWLRGRCPERVPARAPGSEQYPALEPAPGRYVLER